MKDNIKQLKANLIEHYLQEGEKTFIIGELNLAKSESSIRTILLKGGIGSEFIDDFIEVMSWASLKQ